MHVENVQRQRDIDEQIIQVASQIDLVGRAKHDGDWIYESIRIAATLWSASISSKTSFSEAAALLQRRGTMRAPISQLVAAMQQTDLSRCWDNMAGVLLWMSIVGGAAARELHEKTWLLSVGMRCIVALLVEHRYALLESLSKLLKVMKLWTESMPGMSMA